MRALLCNAKDGIRALYVTGVQTSALPISEDGVEELMPTRSDVLSEQLDELRTDLSALWVGLTRDPTKEARKARVWMVFTDRKSAAKGKRVNTSRRGQSNTSATLIVVRLVE